METYFCRINSRCDVAEEMFERLWRERRVAIHFPWTRGRGGDPASRVPDTRSVDPEDFEGHHRRAVAALAALARGGGYVLVEQSPPGAGPAGRRMMAGVVPGGSKIELLECRWRSRPGRRAVLKTIRLKRALEVPPDLPALHYAKPRQGTLMRWPGAGDLVERLVEGRRLGRGVGSLSPEVAEVMCAEYLRAPGMARRAARIETLLAPVGRTMYGVDIWGVGPGGAQVLAQVTRAEGPALEAKCEKLRAVGGRAKRARLVMFAPRASCRPDPRILFIPLEEVFAAFLGTPRGKRWWKLAGR